MCIWGKDAGWDLGGWGFLPALSPVFPLDHISSQVPPRQNYFSAECWGVGAALAAAHPTTAIGLVAAARGGAAIQSFMSVRAMAACA